MSFTVNSPSLDRFAEAGNMPNLTLVEVHPPKDPYKTANAVLVGAVVLLSLSLLILGGWAVLLWIPRVEKRAVRKMVDVESDDEEDMGKGAAVKEV